MEIIYQCIRGINHYKPFHVGVVIDKNTTIPWIGEWNTLHPTKLPTMILYFDHSYEWDYWVEPTVQAYPAEFRYFYTVPGTKISVAAMQPLENVLPQPMPFVSSQPAANLVSPE